MNKILMTLLLAMTTLLLSILSLAGLSLIGNHLGMASHDPDDDVSSGEVDTVNEYSNAK